VIDGVRVRVLVVHPSARRARAWHALRCLLSEVTGDATPPDAWRFTRGDWGEPIVDGPGARALCGSVSYGAGIVAVAASAAREVGVDVTPIAPCGTVPAHELSPRERVRLAEAPPPDRATSEARMWALKEAFAKCDGRGASIPFATIDTTVAFPDPYDRAVALVDAERGPHVVALVAGRHLSDAPAGAGAALPRPSARRLVSR
jgi:phosphopantetheinyl transferase